jgi:hypothetical protein
MTRDEQKFEAAQRDGSVKEYTIVPFITVDDLMLIAMEGIAGEMFLGVPYKSVQDREVVEFLTRVNVGSS